MIYDSLSCLLPAAADVKQESCGEEIESNGHDHPVGVHAPDNHCYSEREVQGTDVECLSAK